MSSVHRSRHVVVQTAESIGRRARMEDALVSYVGSTVEVYGVCDGHGTARVSRWLADNLPLHIASIVGVSDGDGPRQVGASIGEAFARAHGALEREVDAFATINSGSTACVMVCLPACTQYYVANCGDSRAVDVAAACAITRDHKPTDAHERARVAHCGGSVVGGRLNGELDMSRAFGDTALRARGLTEQPDVYGPFDLRAAHVLIACDGVFDVLDDAHVAQLAATHRSQAALAVCDAALCAGSSDNLSVVCVRARPVS